MSDENDKEWLKGTPFSKWIKRLEKLEKLENRAWDSWTHKIETEINTMKQYSGFNRKRLVELEQKIDKNVGDIRSNDGWTKDWAEKVNTLSAVIKETINYLPIESIYKRQLKNKLEGEPSIHIVEKEGLRYGTKKDPSKDIWRDFKKDYPLIKEEQEASNLGGTLGYCKNYDSGFYMCQNQECGKCFSFVPKERKEAPRKGEAEPDVIHGVETACPSCGFKVNHYFKAGKQLIAEFLVQLKSVHSTLRNIQVSNTPERFSKTNDFLISLLNTIVTDIKEWEGRKE